MWQFLAQLLPDSQQAITGDVMAAPGFATRGEQLETHAAEADFSKAFGTPESTDPYQHLLGARLGWGGLPPQDAQYFQAMTTATGADVWTFPVPPLHYDHNGYFSVIKYDEMGWLDVDRPGPRDVDETREFIERIRATPITPA